MVALDTATRREGRKAMEESLTAAQRVRRQLNVGRPRKLTEEKLSALVALQILMESADKARQIMGAQTPPLNPDLIKLALVYSAVLPSGKEGVGFKWLRQGSESIDEYVLEIAKLASEAAFIGILWRLIDTQASEALVWTTPLVAGPDVEIRLYAARLKCVEDLERA